MSAGAKQYLWRCRDCGSTFRLSENLSPPCFDCGSTNTTRCLGRRPWAYRCEPCDNMAVLYLGPDEVPAEVPRCDY